MTDESTTSLRLRLILGKYQVVKLDKGTLGWRAFVDLGHSVTKTIDCPVQADVRLWDWLTVYTEVPYKEPADALPQPAPVE